jgi:hypothetical protein
MAPPSAFQEGKPLSPLPLLSKRESPSPPSLCFPRGKAPLPSRAGRALGAHRVVLRRRDGLRRRRAREGVVRAGAARTLACRENTWRAGPGCAEMAKAAHATSALLRPITAGEGMARGIRDGEALKLSWDRNDSENGG